MEGGIVLSHDLHESKKKSRNSPSAHLLLDLKTLSVLTENLQGTVNTLSRITKLLSSFL